MSVLSLLNLRPALPQTTDHLVGMAGKKNVVMLIDQSCSMVYGPIVQNCPAEGFNNELMNKQQMATAALRGCVTGTDGVFDMYADQVNFAVIGFGIRSSTERHVDDFTSDVGVLEAAAQPTDEDLTVYGNTPMTDGLRESAMLLRDYYARADAETRARTCDQTYVVMLTDGDPNGGCQGWAAYDYACDGSNLACVAAEPWEGAAYNREHDIVCSVPGEQNLTTYTIGFGAEGSFTPSNLEQIATRGGGRYFQAAQAIELQSVFSSILADITQRPALAAAPGVVNAGLFLDNYVFANVFQPQSRMWDGNVKKFCVLPERNPDGTWDTANQDCILTSPDGTRLSGNAAPLDLYTRDVAAPTGTETYGRNRGYEVREGGAGYLALGLNAGVSGIYPQAAPPGTDVTGWTNHYGQRRVATWIPGDAAGFFRPVPPPGPTGTLAAPGRVLTDEEAFASGCTKQRMFAALYGYDPASFDCYYDPADPNDYFGPTQTAPWPIGGIVNSGATVLAWGDCDLPGQCLVAAGGADGGLHFFDTADGRGEERLMLIPGDLWVPGVVANFPLAEITRQPRQGLSRIPYVDGDAVLVHEDLDGDALIDGSEPALLMWSLGLGGRALYFMDVRTPLVGAPSGVNDHPVYPIRATPSTGGVTAERWTENLRDQLSTPAIGRGVFDGVVRTFAAFGSGTVWHANDGDAPFPETPMLTNPVDYNSAVAVDCATLRDEGAPGSVLCDALPPLCTGGYDSAACLGGAVSHNSGYCVELPGAAQIGQLQLSQYDIGAGDVLVIEDELGAEITRITGRSQGPVPPPPPVSFWTGDANGNGAAGFCLRLLSDGIDDGATGFALASAATVQVVYGEAFNSDCCDRCDLNSDGVCSSDECTTTSSTGLSISSASCEACDQNQDGTCDNDCGGTGGACAPGRATECGGPCGASGTHDPFFMVMDVSAIAEGAVPAFASGPEAYDDLDLAMFTRACPSTGTRNCMDAGDFAVLNHMVCPISAEPATFEEGGLARSWYVFDECGQLWKFWKDGQGQLGTAGYDVQRLLALNENWGPTESARSRAFRKVQSRVDLVPSDCSGRVALNIHFGTGHQLLAGAVRDPADPASGAPAQAQSVTGQHPNYDVLGMLVDDWPPRQGPSTPVRLQASATADSNCGGDCLTDVTQIAEVAIGARGPNFRGWFWRLEENERMLSSPVTVRGTSFYKTFQPSPRANSCDPAGGVETFYAVNYCSGAPAQGQSLVADRVVNRQDAWIPSEIFVWTPPDAEPIVGTLGPDGTGNVAPPPARPRRPFDFWMWRVPQY